MAAHEPAFTAPAPLPRVAHEGTLARCGRRTTAPFAAASRDATAASAPPLIDSDATHVAGGNGAELGLDVDEPPAVSTFADVDEILRLADEFDLGDLRIESGGVSVEITREGGRGFVDGVLREPAAPPAVAPSPTQVQQHWEGESAIESGVQDVDAAAVTEADEEWAEDAKSEETETKIAADPNVVYDSDFVVTSNRVGFFFSGARNKPPLVNIGDHVAFNQPVCIIEQLGQQYVYLSEVSGTVTKIFVEDGDAVQYDQQVMVIRPD